MLSHDPGPEAFMTLRGLHAHFDAERFRYLADLLEPSHPHTAALARRWAEEHAALARRERDALEPGFRVEPPPVDAIADLHQEAGV